MNINYVVAGAPSEEWKLSDKKRLNSLKKSNFLTDVTFDRPHLRNFKKHFFLFFQANEYFPPPPASITRFRHQQILSRNCDEEKKFSLLSTQDAVVAVVCVFFCCCQNQFFFKTLVFLFLHSLLPFYFTKMLSKKFVFKL